MEPFYNKNALNRYCKGIPVTAKGALKMGLKDHCPCRLSWLCDGIFHSHMLNQFDDAQAALKAAHFPDVEAAQA